MDAFGHQVYFENIQYFLTSVHEHIFIFSILD